MLSKCIVYEASTLSRLTEYRLYRTAPAATQSTSAPPQAPATRPMLSELPSESGSANGMGTPLEPVRSWIASETTIGLIASILG
eukprot:2399647-Rhodomonas_salina.1